MRRHEPDTVPIMMGQAGPDTFRNRFSTERDGRKPMERGWKKCHWKVVGMMMYSPRSQGMSLNTERLVMHHLTRPLLEPCRDGLPTFIRLASSFSQSHLAD